MADSVVKGCLITAKSSSLLTLLAERRGYLALRGKARVLGRWKEVVVRILRLATPLVPFSLALRALRAFSVAGALAALATLAAAGLAAAGLAATVFFFLFLLKRY